MISTSNVKSKSRVKSNDIVKIMAGKDSGKKGKVLKSFPSEAKVIVEGLNMVKRHTKPNDKNREGGIVDKESKIDISNVMLVCPKCDKATRVGRKFLDDGKKVRVCKKCSEVIE